jgi:hypothetical protein
VIDINRNRARLVPDTEIVKTVKRVWRNLYPRANLTQLRRLFDDNRFLSLTRKSTGRRKAPNTTTGDYNGKVTHVTVLSYQAPQWRGLRIHFGN